MRLRIVSTRAFCLSIAFCTSIASYVANGKDGPRPATGTVQILPGGNCEVDKRAVQCDRVARRLQSQHLSRETGIIIFANDAPYETVVATLDSLKKVGFADVRVFPPFMGTNPSKSLKHWIKLVPQGLQNHIFWKVMITTESFRNWGETLIVLSESDFAIVDRLALSRIAQGNCAAKIQDIPKDLRGSENRLWLFDHGDELTQSCLFPRAATSCDFLSTVMRLPDVHWGTGDLEAISKVVSEIGCNARS
jgi:hypothetical protein